MEIFGYISAILFFVAYLPQLVRTYRRRTVEDISISMWIFTLCAYLSGLVYGISLSKDPLILSYALGTSCTVLMIVMYYLYRDPQKDRAERIIRQVLKEFRRKLK